jgi:methyltransferase (TIGR00027 family)
VTGNRIDAYTEQTFHRSGLDGLPAHLAGQYGIDVTELTEFDVGVFRVDRRDGPSWVARVFPAARPVAAAQGDAEILRYLAERDFPAERCARDPAVSVHDDQAVLVTGHVPGPKAGRGQRTSQQLGSLLGRLHTLPPPAARLPVPSSLRPFIGAVARPGGAWHHLAFGGPRAEVDAAISLLDAARDRVPAGQAALHTRLRDALTGTDDAHGLPEALIHPDFVAANAIAAPVPGEGAANVITAPAPGEGEEGMGGWAGGGSLTMVDWAGAGRGPRLWSLAFLLWAAGGRDLAGVDAVVAGYLEHVRPEPAELTRLAGTILTRPLIFACWAFCVGRRELPAVLDELPALRDHADAIAARATQAFTRDSAASAPPHHSAPPEQEPSTGVGTTGVAVAAIRAAETNRPDRLFADPFAAAFVAASGWTPTAPPGDRRVAGLRAWIVARTVFLDELLASACQDGCLQVVLLGAGFDARAYRLSWPPGLRCFELDTTDVLDHKARVLATQAAQSACERIPVACDLRDDWPGVLLAAGFTPGRPTAWIAEGLLVYLEPDDVDGVLADLTPLSAPGSRLGLTLSGRPPAANGGGPVRWDVTLRRSVAPDDPVGWLSGHGWRTDQMTGAAEVLGAHGRDTAASPPRPRGRRPGGLLIAATRDPR